MGSRSRTTDKFFGRVVNILWIVQSVYQKRQFLNELMEKKKTFVT